MLLTNQEFLRSICLFAPGSGTQCAPSAAESWRRGSPARRKAAGPKMTIQVTGKNVEAGEAYTGYISNRIATALEKYVGSDISGHIRLEKEKGRFRTDCSIKLQTGLVLEARGDGNDAYQSADAAVERLETRVRRHKRRLKRHGLRSGSAPGRSIRW